MTTKKTIPFTLEAWKAGGKPVTRGGDPVYDLAYMPNAKKDESLVGVHDAAITFWFEDGSFMHPGGKSSLDLFLEVQDFPVPDEGYTFLHFDNQMPNKFPFIWSFILPTEESAKQWATNNPERRTSFAIYKLTKVCDL